MVYRCTVCGYVYDEEKEGKPFSQLTQCPLCKQPPEKFEAGWDNALVLGAQLSPMPLDEHADVPLKTVIGKHAQKPMVPDMPVYISHMSFGALSKETKIALARGSAAAGTGMCPVGGATQDEAVRDRLLIAAAARRVENYLRRSAGELTTFARITGNTDIHGLSIDGLCTVSRDIWEHRHPPRRPDP